MAAGCCSSGKCHASTTQESVPPLSEQQETTASSHSSSETAIITAKSASDITEKMGCCGLSQDYDTEPDVDEQNDGAQTQPTEPGHVPDTRRVVLTIEGLKCGCCGADSGISRVLEQIPGVHNHNVNVVLARAEFDLDTRATTVNKVRKRLMAATGYTYKQYFQPDGQILELIVNDPREMCRAGRPFGVDSVEPIVKSAWTSRIFGGRNSEMSGPVRSSPSPPPSPPFLPSLPKGPAARIPLQPMKKPMPGLARNTVRIHYDAKKIGGRDVLHYYEGCLGSKIQLAPPAPPPSLALGAQQTKRAGWLCGLAALFTVPVLVFAWGKAFHGKMLYAHISLSFASVIQAIAIWEFFPSACRTLIHSRVFDMDALIALSTTVAYIYSVISYTREIKGSRLDTGSFFETSTLLVTLILFGRLVSEFARSRAANSVSFRSLQVDEALLVLHSDLSSDPKTSIVDSRLLQYGDRFKVLPESRIVTDGIVVHGGSEVDESMLTGETLPVAKSRQSTVQAGTVNGTGTLIVSLTKLSHENSVSKIATLVESAELTKPKVQAIADRVAAWFVPVITAIALLVFIIWFCVEKYHSHRNNSSAAIKAFTYSIATFVVSCPCAIGLAVPMVVLIASGVAARSGIIFRDPQKLEMARSVTDVVFDKTGTLTEDVLQVVDQKFKRISGKELRGLLLGLLNGIKHPVSVAVYESILENNIRDRASAVDMASIQSIPGEGIQGTTRDGNRIIKAGNPEWVGIDPSIISYTNGQHNFTVLCISIDGEHKATFWLQSRIRYAAKATINNLKRWNIRVHLLTGDNDPAAASVASTLSIPYDNVRSRCKPAQKKEYIEALQANGRTVMFVGDGTNDAAALKASAVGVHLNRGSDVAKSAADIVLMNPALLDVCILLDISRAAYRRIVANFVWSFVYNTVAVLAAAGALRVWRIEPKFAGLGELVSVLPVVGVAFSMKWGGYAMKYSGIYKAIPGSAGRYGPV